jgi:hypothetical protein
MYMHAVYALSLAIQGAYHSAQRECITTIVHLSCTHSCVHAIRTVVFIHFRIKQVASDFAFLPFGGGQRKCVGDQFALMEAVVTMAMLLRRFDFTLVSACLRTTISTNSNSNAAVLMLSSSMFMLLLQADDSSLMECHYACPCIVHCPV